MLWRSVMMAVTTGHAQVIAVDIVKNISEIVQELSKCVLIDVELQKYRPSLVVAGLFSIALEIKLHQMFEGAGKTDQDYKNSPIPITKLLRLCC